MRNIAKDRETEQARSDFITTASHEMRGPVANIEGHLGLALSSQTATIDDRAKAYLEKAHEASRQLGQIFQNLLDASQLEDQDMRSNPEPVEMISLVKSIADEMAPTFAAKGLAYHFGEPDAIGNAASLTTRKIDQVIYCSLDVEHLRHIMNSLIDNAIKYTPSGGKIAIAIAGTNTDAIVSIADTGVGISRESQDHVFKKFYRADNTHTRTIQGAGLGLYVTKRRAAAMNGHIWLESVEGKGSKFFISFPRISSVEYEQQKMVMSSNMKQVVSNVAPSSSTPSEDEPAIPAPAPTPTIKPITATPIAPAEPPPAAAPAETRTVDDLDPEDLAKRKAEFMQSVQSGGVQNV
jgi:signal transduction histidine kinase